MIRKIAAVWVSLAMLFTFIIIVEIAPIVHAPNTIYVDDDLAVENTTHKKTIQAGVNAAQPGDAVFVYNGTYLENVVINKEINLIGMNRDNTTIDGGGSGDVVYVSADRVNITSFRVRGSGSSSGDSGIKLWSVKNCRISKNIVSDNEQGISLYYSDDNIITGNRAPDNKFGIYLTYSDGNNITDNIAYSNNEHGVYIYFSHGNNIENNTVSSNNQQGINFVQSNNNIISGNNISLNNEHGIQLGGTIGNNLAGNIISEDGIYIAGSSLENWNTHEINMSNTVNGKPLYYWKNRTGGIVPFGAGQVILANCNRVRVENQEISNTSVGIILGFSSNNEIIGNNVSSNTHFGIYLQYSNENNVTQNNATANPIIGISLFQSNRNNITNNTVNSNGNDGIALSNANENTIMDNNISSNTFSNIKLEFSSYQNSIKGNILSNSQRGFYISNSNSNTIAENQIISNPLGVHIVFSGANNIIYHNNFLDSQGYDDEGSNYWDIDYPMGGNYWYDYGGVDNFKGPNQNIVGRDDIGDTPYTNILGGAGAQDNYPLMSPYKPLENYTILKQGWNLISIPLIQEEKNLTRVLGSIDSWYDAIQWHNATDLSDPWKHHKVGKPFGNDLSHLNESMGFWIHITNPGDTIFLYNGTQITTNQSITLYPGWNMVGYPSLTSYNRTEGLNNLTFDDQVDAIWSYDAFAQKWEKMGESDYFQIGKGYYIHAKSECEWEVPL